VKLQENKNIFFITVPKDYIRLKKWKKRQNLVFTVNQDGDLILKEV